MYSSTCSDSTCVSSHIYAAVQSVDTRNQGPGIVANGRVQIRVAYQEGVHTDKFTSRRKAHVTCSLHMMHHPVWIWRILHVQVSYREGYIYVPPSLDRSTIISL
jgi:hypothetical protein